MRQTSKGEINEIILINSHNGTSYYQMLAGMFRFVCMNGLVIRTSLCLERWRCNAIVRRVKNLFKYVFNDTFRVC